MVSVVTLHMHRRPDLYEDPHIFNPDRFLAENLDAIHQFSYLPFSAGSRNCIGTFFLYIIKLLILTINNFNFLFRSKVCSIRNESDISEYCTKFYYTTK